MADLILDAAHRLLASRGYRGLTMEELAEQVGIGQGTRIAHREAPAPERLRQMLLARALFRFDSVAHYAASLSDLLAAIRPALLARRQRHFEEEARVFAEVLRDGHRAGRIADLLLEGLLARPS